ncbi:NADH oxidase [Streptomyces sp. NBC_01283]|uniref:NADH oxidase n=1 Tax=Streptomyces sp. NBC_01283 TaxID=2903812 RepID=UPI00352DAD9C|nr:NADH oxidase [Streptomyces sp. NBC_01283]
MEATIDLLELPGGRLRHLWSLREDVEVESDAVTGSLVLTWDQGTARLACPEPTVLEVLRRMQLGPVLLGNALLDDGEGGRDRDAKVYVMMRPVFGRFPHLLVRTLALDGLSSPLLSFAPLPEASGASLTVVPLDQLEPIRLFLGLSFAFDPLTAVFESRTASHRLVIHRQEAMMVFALALARPVTLRAITAVLPLPADVTEGILCYLAAAGVAAQPGA